jgi:ribonuclease HI
MSEWTIHIDGAARGNPGPAAAAVVIERPGESDIEFTECLGAATNNFAEYTALLHALALASEMGGKRLRVFSDSELLVKQISGEYRVKDPTLKRLYDQAVNLIDDFDSVKVQHVRREANKRADALCNAALDAQKKQSPQPGGARKADTASLEDRIRGEALACLDNAALAWSRGNAKDPPTAIVWDQLWSIIEEAGVLKKPSRK